MISALLLVSLRVVLGKAVCSGWFCGEVCGELRGKRGQRDDSFWVTKNRTTGLSIFS